MAACTPPPPGARTLRLQQRVQRSPAVFVQLRSSRAAPAHPGAAPAGKPSQPAGPTAAAARESAAPPPSERNVVSAGTRWRDGAQAWEARRGARELRELGAGAASSASVHGKVGMDTARAGSLGDRGAGASGNRGKCSRGLGWSV